MLDKIRLHLRRELHEDYRRGGVAAQPWRDDAVGLGEVLEERDGGRRVIGKPWRKRSGRALTAPPTIV